MARGALPHAHPLAHEPLAHASRSRRPTSCFVFGTPFDFRVDYGRTRHLERRREGRADRSRRRRARAQPRASTSPSTATAASCSSSSLAERRDAKPTSARGSPRCAPTRTSGARKMQRRDRRRTSRPPNPLRVCAELGKRLGPNDIVIGDGGDFVATAAYVLKLEWPQLWMDPGPARHARRRPRLRDGREARAPRRATSCSSTATAASASTRSSSRRWCARTSRSSRVIGNDAGWTQIRRGQVELYGEPRAVATGARLHALRRRWSRRCGGFGAWVEQVEELGPALDAAFAARASRRAST